MLESVYIVLSVVGVTVFVISLFLQKVKPLAMLIMPMISVILFGVVAFGSVNGEIPYCTTLSANLSVACGMNTFQNFQLMWMWTGFMIIAVVVVFLRIAELLTERRNG